MKILNDITYYLNWIELNLNSIERKWDANCCIRYWKFACDYGFFLIIIFKKKHLSIPIYLRID